jgi:hypothetical protein
MPTLPPRYFDKDLRKVVYGTEGKDGGDYWSSPVRPGYQLGSGGGAKASGRRLQQQQQFLRENDLKIQERPVAAPRPALDIDILSLLDHRMLGKIKRDFRRRKHPLSLEEFVEVMTQYVPLHSIAPD